MPKQKQKTDPYALILIISFAIMCWSYIALIEERYDREIENQTRIQQQRTRHSRLSFQNQRDNRRAEQTEQKKFGIIRRTQFTVKKARITKYVKTGNRMANGEWPYEGAVAVSDRRVVLGTKLKIFGRVFTVADRTALWVDKQRGFTVDIYTEESKEAALKWGVRYEDVIIEEL